MHLHFTGIGGAGMSSMAWVLHQMGYTVSGSDLRETDTTRWLAAQGLEIFVGQTEENITHADLVIYSSAVSQSNPERQAAQAAGIPQIRRAEILGDMQRLFKTSIGVAGTHGKTTTTTMIARALQAAGVDPSWVIGGIMSAQETTGHLGNSEYFVAEADEYDRSFHTLNPTIAVINNIEADHLDIYQSYEKLVEGFLTYCDKVAFYGFIAVGIDDPELNQLLPKINRRVVTFGLAEAAEYRAVNIKSGGIRTSFDLLQRGSHLTTVTLQVPGEHNIKNALAALTVVVELGLPLTEAVKGLEAYRGIRRRFELKGEIKNIIFIDDYAHHPGEIRATLEAARAAWPERRLVAFFQPHLFSRTETLAIEFGKALTLADVAVICEIYPAREDPIPGVTSQLVADACHMAGVPVVHYFTDTRTIPKFIHSQLRPGDVVVTMGAGDIDQVNDAMRAAWEQPEHD
ncbi:MAG: UDP-N-acetylmuramate--L-alanine ligase [Candidatus Marinimicrobia bacterium]|nr:UDP-N-acetylmuramate--L-alanine ligase [Candidatus Neomarinimicrobiota bacterium]MCF7903408.1 UDP-N-acetylmuramate--L-alanine ligase [Candidatus Neomarinimicrobiota bacterium]